MSEPKWTPGSWRLRETTAWRAEIWGRHRLYGEERCLASVSEANSEDVANARLIAAAPELYSRLEWLTQQVIDLGWTCTEELATLAKARGDTL